ncbi:MAG: DEAD/DEAH box helicase [Candidatus Helarchaeota archaeon]
MSIVETFSEIEHIIENKFFKEKISKFISKLTRENNDKFLLDKISLNQILDASYIYYDNPKTSVYSNFLCPKNLYEMLNYTTWRLHSFEEVSFLIIGNSSNNKLEFELNLQYFTPNILRKSLIKKSSSLNTTQKSIEIKHKLEEQLNLNNEENIKKIFKESNTILGPLSYIHKKYTIYIDISKLLRNNEKKVEFNENFKINLKFTNIQNIIKKFPTKNPSKELVIKLENEDFKHELNFTVELLKEPFLENNNNKIFLIKFKFKNLNKLNSKKPRRDTVIRNSIICPLMEITLKKGKFLKYHQRLENVYEIIKTENQEEINRKFSENLKILRFFDQINCILSFSYRNNEEKIFISPFGIFDKPREYPIEGPLLGNLSKSFDEIKKYLSDLKKKEITFLENNYSQVFNKPFSELLLLLFKSLNLYLQKLGIEKPCLWRFQWDNIQWRLKYLIKKFLAFKNGEPFESISRIIKAPTGSGKTLIFFVDSILHYMFTSERIVIMFPTRILNIEMFQNLTLLIYCLRKNGLLYDCGLYIGIRSFNLTEISLNKPNSPFPLIPKCPKCLKVNSIITIRKNFRVIGKCRFCGHEVSYIYMPKEITDYLPIISIATPDKLFYDVFLMKYPYISYKFFGAPVIKCPKCERYNSYLKKDVQIAIKNKSTFNCNNNFPPCDGEINPNKIICETKPIGLIILDEVHSLYGYSGIILSVFFRFLNIFQKILTKSNNLKIDFESGTATIANEEDFFRALTNQKISSFPSDIEYFSKYFKYKLEKIRYRILVQAITYTSVRNAFSRAIINDHIQNNYHNEIENELENMSYNKDAFKLLVGYLFRKSDGYTIKNSIYNFSKENNKVREDLKPPLFISGDASSELVSRFLNKVNNNDIRCFLANLIISLGMNFKNLNNMILYAAPKSINEQVQTIGRLGREDCPGHSSILLMPNRPRDEFFYRNFHKILVDIKGYLEVQPIQATNIFISKMIIGNLINALMNAYLRYDYRYGMRERWLFFMESTKNNERFYGLNTLYKLLKKILVINTTEYQSLSKDIEGIIKGELKDLLKSFRVNTNIRFVSEYFGVKRKLLNSIRGTKDEIEILIDESNICFTENKSIQRFKEFIDFEENNLLL